jgi:hypothetical protein
VKRWAASLGLLVFGLIAGLFVLEAGLQLAGFRAAFIVPDPTIGYRYIPHARYRHAGEEGASVGRFNAAGWRDVDHTAAKPANTTRILLLGDSFTAAFQVALDSTFHRRLERALNAHAEPGHRFEVVALGEDGNGTAAEYLTYTRWGRPYDPDVVAVLFVLNDQADNWRPTAIDTRRPFFVEDGDSVRLDASFSETPEFRGWQHRPWISTRSALWTALRETRSRLTARPRPVTRPGERVEDGYYRPWNFDPRLPADSIPAFRATRKLLDRFARDVARDHRRFVVFAAGFAHQEDREMLAAARGDSTFDPEKPLRWLRSIGARDSFDVVPLTPDFRAASAAGGGPYWFGHIGAYGHWNDAGHAVAARAMARYFEGTLPGLAAGP